MQQREFRNNSDHKLNHSDPRRVLNGHEIRPIQTGSQERITADTGDAQGAPQGGPHGQRPPGARAPLRPPRRRRPARRNRGGDVLAGGLPRGPRGGGLERRPDRARQGVLPPADRQEILSQLADLYRGGHAARATGRLFRPADHRRHGPGQRRHLPDPTRCGVNSADRRRERILVLKVATQGCAGTDLRGSGNRTCRLFTRL